MATMQAVVDVTAKPSKKYMDKVLGYLALTKPRIIELLLITTVPTMFLAKKGVPGLALVLWTVAGGTLAAGGANGANMVIDRDIDAKMQRTNSRPLVTGAVSWQGALVFSVLLEIAAFIMLLVEVNLLSAILALGATLFYVFVYTLLLKRNSTQNIVIGGAAGAMPVLVGWAAVTGGINLTPILLAAVIFTWTPPHFWALAIKYKEDYSNVNVPMLPAVKSLRRTTNEIIAYTIVTVVLTVVLIPLAKLNLIYVIAAVVGGVAFIYYSFKLKFDPTLKRALSLFKYSITYLTVLFLAVGVDALLIHRLQSF